MRFWFATGGAGFCLSQTLALKMMPLIGGGKFEDIGDKIRLPDDVTMGYVAEHLLEVPMTVISDFHSHMEPHKALPGNDPSALAEGISYSYVLKEDSQMSNILEITDGFPLEEDPTRYVSLIRSRPLSTRSVCLSTHPSRNEIFKSRFLHFFVSNFKI